MVLRYHHDRQDYPTSLVVCYHFYVYLFFIHIDFYTQIDFAIC